MFCIRPCRNYFLWTFAARILWKTQPWDIFARLPTAKCIPSSNHDVYLKDDYCVPFFDLKFFIPILRHMFCSPKHLRRKGLRKLKKNTRFCGSRKETFISDGRKIQVNSSKKYINFFCSANDFSTYISPLIWFSCAFLISISINQ